jgi:hypothetical protein
MTPNVQNLPTEHLRVLHGGDHRIDRDSSTARDAVADLSLVPVVRALMLVTSPAVKEAERARDVGTTVFTPRGPPAA